jgi:hypothetical protein
VLLNLSRDQLDRVGEINHIERTLRAGLAHHPESVVVANCDDVLMTSAAYDSPNVVWVAAGGGWAADSVSCPRSGEVIVRDGAQWHSTGTHFRRPEPQCFITKHSDEEFSYWRIKLPHLEAATFDAALASHRDALVAEWKRDHGDRDSTTEQVPPVPDTIDAFMRLVEAGWDADATRRPHGHRTTVVVHVDIDKQAAAYHLGPLLSDSERGYLTCDATCEVWFERDGEVIGAGRATRVISRRLRRALEHRDRACVVPGCGATRGLHAHHIRHWEDGGRTDLANLVLLCPYHHRWHHRGGITVAGTAYDLTITDSDGRALSDATLAHPPATPPPAVAPCPGPTGERADWWWYQPFQPQAPPTSN